jgi:hypothetical protein
MKNLLLFFLLQATLTATAQTETIIRNHYTEVNKKIAESIEQGYEGPLYQNQLVINKNGKSYPAVGYYADTLNFWYDDSPDHLSPADRDPKKVLLKVTKSSRIGADVRAIEEYLYLDGKLIFYYSWWAEESNLWETRVYYNSKGIAFKIRVKENEKELTAKELATADHKDQQPNTARIMTTGKSYQTLFLNSM